MRTALAGTPLAIGLIGAAALSIWIAIRAYRQRQGPALSEAAWPFEFSVYMLDYYIGPRFARFARCAQVAFYAPYFLMGAVDALFFAEDHTGIFMLTLLVSFCSAAVGTFLPIRCRLDDRGIHLQNQLYPWDAIRRWSVNERRLQIVGSRSTNRSLQFTLEIPLNGLSPTLGPWLDEQIAEHVNRNTAVLS